MILRTNHICDIYDTRDHYTVEMKNGHHSKVENKSYRGTTHHICIRPAKMHNLKRSDYYKHKY